MQACLSELQNNCYKPGWTAKHVVIIFQSPSRLWHCQQMSCWGLYFVFDISVGNAWLKISYLLAFWLSSIHTDLLVEFQHDQDIHAGRSVGLASIFPAIDNTIKRCLCACHRVKHFPLVCMGELLLHPWIFVGSFLQMQQNNSECFSVISWPPTL